MMRAAIVGAVLAGSAFAVRTPPALSVSLTTQTQGDSITVKASWAGACNALGCPDGYRVTWLVNGVALPLRTTPNVRDSTRAYRLPCPSNTIVQVAVVAMRRGWSSSGTTQTRTIACVDAPPPPVDSLTIDTSFVARAARDSYPVWELRQSQALRAIGDTAQACLFARNRYTHAITVRRVPGLSDQDLVFRCGPAAAQYATERGT